MDRVCRVLISVRNGGTIFYFSMFCEWHFGGYCAEPSQHVNTAVRGVRGRPVGQFGRIHGSRRRLMGRMGRVDGLGRRWHSGLLDTRELPHVVAAPHIIINTSMCIPCNSTCTIDLVFLLFTAVGDYSVCTYRGSNWHMRAISQHIFGIFDLHQQCFCYLLEGS